LNNPLTVISLGAGVQSSTMSLMAMHGEFDVVPDAAIFADTGAEPDSVYEWLEYLEPLLSFPVHRVMYRGGLLENIKASVKGGRNAGAPFFVKTDKDKEGALRRQCTQEFKVVPITKQIRKMIGLKDRQRAPNNTILVKQWIGISLDEVQRMKPSRMAWIEHEWPLIDKRMSRHDCLKWMSDHGYPAPPKSACTFCPFRNDNSWRDMKRNDESSWTQAADVDELIRKGVSGVKNELYLHRSLTPLKDVDLRSETEMGQLDFFNNECEGLCGI